MLKSVLLVEGDRRLAAILAENIRELAVLDHHVHFQTARKRLMAAPLALIVANLRLGAFNGLHLVYLAATLGASVRTIVYADRHDVVAARDVQRAGAFYETRERLPAVLGGYVRALLPSADRRDSGLSDRR